MFNFKDKIVWITGASSGIGEALAKAFAAEGAKLVLTARRLPELQRVVNSFESDKDQHLIFSLDMEHTLDFQPYVDQVLSKYGRIDYLINNAGISQRDYVVNSSIDVFTKLIQINYLSVVALTKAILPHMMAQKSGHIAAISSVSGRLGSPKRAGYAGSKHALHGFFDGLRSEVSQHGLAVTLVCPGYIKTNISVNALSGQATAHGKMDDNQARGMLPEVCAQKILKALARKKSEVYIGGKEVMGVYLKRFFPSILEKILLNQIPK